MAVTNVDVRTYPFLLAMSEDPYFPSALVEKGKTILLELCAAIEAEPPRDLPTLYQLTQAATEDFNDLNEEFQEQNSEIETTARDCIGMDFQFIAEAYGFKTADAEELIATREW